MTHAHELDLMTEKKLFKNYALAICIASEYKELSISKDAGRALTGYREFGKLDLGVYRDAYALLEDWKSKPYLSQSGDPIKLARCIDFHNSPEIENLFLENNPCLDDTNWRDKSQFKVRCPLESSN